MRAGGRRTCRLEKEARAGDIYVRRVFAVGSNADRVVLITGASSGIGQACARHLHQRGYRVYGSSRRAPTQGAADAAGFQMIRMDVTSADSVSRGVGLVLEQEGRIDVVVNNAGMGIAGAVEDTSIEEAQAQMDTNFFGAFRVCHAALPAMREQGGGCIVNISSGGGRVGIPFQAIYSASKFAIEALTEALRMEVKPFGIRVAMIEPGDLNTGFTASRRRTAASGAGSAYSGRFEKALGVIEADETGGPSPEKVGPLLERIINGRSPRLRYVVGPLFESIALGLKRFFPARVFEWGFMKYYKLS
jgi:NAD(P)-dependent dehydrogenase (short-subunit alcohol dehydrogenase family)